ncbi:hypothetical protein GIB67_010276, partial [Kingdonia uniflora]
MTGVGASKKRGVVGEERPVLRRATEMIMEDIHVGTTLCKLALKYPKKKAVKGDCRLLKGICLRIEEEKTEFESGRVKLEKKVARLESDLALERERLVVVKAAHKELKDMRIRIEELENELAKKKNDLVSLLT